MGHRATAALIGFSLVCLPAVAAAQDDLDDLMTADPDDAGGAEGSEEEAPEGEEDEPEALGEEWDPNEMDDERPPGDPTAFADPEEEEPEEEVEPEDEGKPISLGVLLGYGVNVDGDLNPWGMGFGLLGGYDAGLINIGVRVGFYLGESTEQPQIDAFGDVVGTEEIDATIWELGVEAGLDIDASEELLIRPGLGFGLATTSVGSLSETNPFFAPGLAVLFSVSPSIYLGLDSRYQLVAGESESISALVFLLNIGLRF